MSEIKHFDHFDLTCNAVAVLRFTASKLSGDALLTELHDQLMAYVESEAPPKLVVDFTGVSWCPSLLINCLLRVKKALTPSGSVMKLCCMEQDVLQAFQMLHLDKSVFQIYPTLDEAISAFE